MFTTSIQMVWLESPTNPLLKVLDIEMIVKCVKSIDASIITVVDNTFLTPYFQVDYFYVLYL